MSFSAIQGLEIPRNSVRIIENILKMFQISLEKNKQGNVFNPIRF